MSTQLDLLAPRTPVVASFVPSATAVVSPCERYRYSLTRAWAPGPRVLFVLLNPSSADATTDDPTLRRCVGYARRWCDGSVEIANLFALRSPDPALVEVGLRTGVEVVGPATDAHLVAAVGRADRVVAGWGSFPWAAPRAAEVTRIVTATHDLLSLRTNADGSPGHPLYLRICLVPHLYRARVLPHE